MAFAESEITAFTYRIWTALETWGRQALELPFFLRRVVHHTCLCLSEPCPMLLRPQACRNIFLGDGSSFPVLMHQQDRLDAYPSILRRAESNTTAGGQEAQWTPESGIMLSQLLALVLSAQKSLFYECFQSSVCFPIPCWTTFIWVF